MRPTTFVRLGRAVLQSSLTSRSLGVSSRSVNLEFQPLLATNYDGALQALVWLTAMAAASLAGATSFALSFFHGTQRASALCGQLSLALLVFTGAFFFFAVVPSFRGSQNGCLSETRWTLGVFTADTAMVLAARFVASRFFSRAAPIQMSDERNA